MPKTPSNIANERGKRADFTRRVADVYGVRPDQVEALLPGAGSQSVRIHRLSNRPVASIRAGLESIADVEPIAWCVDAFTCAR